MPALQQWQVYFLPNCRLAKPLPKDKFVVLACFDPNPCGFFINTAINRYIQQRPQLLPCEVLLQVSRHPFLQYDSWLDCMELLSLQSTELTDLRGRIDPATIQDILSAVRSCPVLRPRFKQLICGEK